MRRDLPNSFRFTGSKAHALAVQQRLRDYYIPEIKSITYEGQYVEPPRPVEWYPDQLAWFMTTPKNVVRRFKPFASFQKFLVAETDVGNITRQEVVSMIPPLVMDLKPGMTVLDMCAAPGSKSAQLIEMLHAGEEDRWKEVSLNAANGLERPAGEDFEDDGRSTGLLIANDVDYKRAHMLVHQMKRLSSPNLLVTNHDATIFPSIKISSPPSADGKPVPNKYLKFDRILADVPCSGDGTVRKNMEIWKNWTPSNGLGLHATQVRILIRALQMLKVGGRVVYSTCSMNPVEDEAVLAESIARCGGPDLVQLLETKDLLPGLKRSPGLKRWTVMDKAGRIWDDYTPILKQKQENSGDDALNKLSASMFPPKTDLPLDRAMRVYPHKQDTGAFFIAILEKKSEIKAKPVERPGALLKLQEGATSTPNGNTNGNGTTNGATPESAEGIAKRKREDEDEDGAPELPEVKRVKSVDMSDNIDSPAVSQPESNQQQPKPQFSGNPNKKNRNQPFEEPFKYLQSSIPEIKQIRDFYNLSPRFPLTRFMVRNADGTATKNIYYTSELTKEILQENEGKGLKFVHAGVKMFVKQDAPSPDVCPWRIQTDGLRLLETWVGPERIVKLRKKETLRRLLIEMFPRFNGEEGEALGEVAEQIREMGMGCCVLIIVPTETDEQKANGGGEDGEGLKEHMVLPLWKSHQSLNLMLPKEERKALLLRLFNDDTPLVNNSKGWTDAQNKSKKENKSENATEEATGEVTNDNKAGVELIDILEGSVDQQLRRNTSSPEVQESKGNVGPVMEVDADNLMAGAESDDGDEGGVALS
jgi:multisite-specific tRNA:(cytosine-C5)-methyltransferase